MNEQLDRTYCVYIIRCITNGKCYIGYTKHYENVISRVKNYGFFHDYMRYRGKKFYKTYYIKSFNTRRGTNIKNVLHI